MGDADYLQEPKNYQGFGNTGERVPITFKPGELAYEVNAASDEVPDADALRELEPRRPIRQTSDSSSRSLEVGQLYPSRHRRPRRPQARFNENNASVIIYQQMEYTFDMREYRVDVTPHCYMYYFLPRQTYSDSQTVPVGRLALFEHEVGMYIKPPARCRSYVTCRDRSGNDWTLLACVSRIDLTPFEWRYELQLNPPYGPTRILRESELLDGSAWKLFRERR
ncbi:hypothetical protein TWF718_008344 [Orbilia javanica]|uniref:Uncharacterized protein n=1 Tax=Orbilia javanica TaxID=47235 RepID=A0AAN8MSH4_9PEZI